MGLRSAVRFACAAGMLMCAVSLREHLGSAADAQFYVLLFGAVMFAFLIGCIDGAA